MLKKISALLSLLLAFGLACAQTADAPVDHASRLSVILFLVLFIGSIVAFGVYVWWRAKSDKEAPAEE